jgi:hypothetical protein
LVEEPTTMIGAEIVIIVTIMIMVEHAIVHQHN